MFWKLSRKCESLFQQIECASHTFSYLVIMALCDTGWAKTFTLLRGLVHLFGGDEYRRFGMNRSGRIRSQRNRRGAHVVREIGNRINVCIAKCEIHDFQFATHGTEELLDQLPPLGSAFLGKSSSPFPW